MTEKRTQFRFAVAAAILMLALAGLGIRLAFLHIGRHDKTLASVSKTRRVERKLLAARGNIYDRNGCNNTLALSLAVKNVCVDPSVVLKSNMVVEVASKLSEDLNVPVDALAVRLNRPGRRYERVKRFVLEEDLRDIVEAELPGVFFEKQIIRYYPHKSFMCHVLGFVNYEGVGSAGIEQSADRFLRGCHGLVENQVNALRQDLYWDEGRYIPAIKGADVTLTLDQNVQFMVEQALDKVMETHSPRGAWAIVEKVRTGEILAMASRPAYSLNEFTDSRKKARVNRAIGHVYEPGSTFKAIAFAAAFNEGLVREDQIIDCEDGSWFHSGRFLRDYHSYSQLSVADGLKKSSNILTAKVALMLGKQRAYRYLKEFGIGEKAGLDLPGEERGILHHVSQWSNISLSRLAIGQGVAVTALQMLGVFCAIANDGFLMRPYVVKEVRGHDGSILLKREPEVLNRPITWETAARMRRLLRRVTEDGGTGRGAAVEGYDVAGKTGTAQKPVAGGYSSTDYMASFVGFLPAKDPEIAIIVVVDEPQPYHTGGKVAGPAFKEIAEQTVRYLAVVPDHGSSLARR